MDCAVRAAEASRCEKARCRVWLWFEIPKLPGPMLACVMATVAGPTPDDAIVMDPALEKKAA